MQIQFRYTYFFAIAFTAWGYLYLFLQPEPEIHQQNTLCLFHLVTGLPCAACGTGRGLICILHGEFSKAWMFNPLSFAVLIFSFIAFSWMSIDLLKNHFTFIPAMKRPVSLRYFIVPLILILINWYWTIAKGL